jgi:hypothetical protein
MRPSMSSRACTRPNVADDDGYVPFVVWLRALFLAPCDRMMRMLVTA